MLKTREQDLALCLSALLGGLLIEALNDSGDNSRLARTGRSLDQRDVRRVECDLDRFLLHVGRIILEYLFADKRGQRLNLFREPERGNLSVFLKQKAELRVRRPALKDGATGAVSTTNLSNITLKGEDELSCLGKILNIKRNLARSLVVIENLVVLRLSPSGLGDHP